MGVSLDRQTRLLCWSLAGREMGVGMTKLGLCSLCLVGKEAQGVLQVSADPEWGDTLGVRWRRGEESDGGGMIACGWWDLGGAGEAVEVGPLSPRGLGWRGEPELGAVDVETAVWPPGGVDPAGGREASLGRRWRLQAVSGLCWSPAHFVGRLFSHLNSPPFLHPASLVCLLYLTLIRHLLCAPVILSTLHVLTHFMLLQP